MEKKYDIFISYKRKDKDLVFPLVKKIETQLGVKCWIDIDGIESSSQFASVICRAIDASEVVLFMHSSSHLSIDFDEDWTVKELNYARAKKKRVILVKLDSAELDNIFLMDYGTKNNIDSNDPLQFEKLINDLRNWLDLPVSEAENTSGQVSIQAQAPTAVHKSIGAEIHVFTDADCKIFDYGRVVTEFVTAHKDTIIILKKGVHNLKFSSIQEPSISYEQEFTVEDNDSIGKLQISLEAEVSRLIAKKKIEEERKEKQEEKEKREAERLKAIVEKENLEKRLKECLPKKISYTVKGTPIVFHLNKERTQYEVMKQTVIDLLTKSMKKNDSTKNDKVYEILHPFRTGLKKVVEFKNDVTQKLDFSNKIQSIAESENIYIKTTSDSYVIPIFIKYHNNFEYFRAKYLK